MTGRAFRRLVQPGGYASNNKAVPGLSEGGDRGHWQWQVQRVLDAFGQFLDLAQGIGLQLDVTRTGGERYTNGTRADELSNGLKGSVSVLWNILQCSEPWLLPHAVCLIYHYSMAKSGVKGFIGGFFSLLVISVLVFLCIYFFLPDISVQYFGMTFYTEKYIEDKVDEAARQLPAETNGNLVSYLTSDEAKADLGELLGELGNDIKAFVSYITSEEGKAMLREKAGQVRELTGRTAE